MSDEDREKFLDQFDSVATSLLVKDRTEGKTCPMCDTEDWRIEVRSKGDKLLPAPVFVVKDTGAWFGPSPAIPAIALSCGNCGFIRLHNIPLLVNSISGPTDGEK